MGTVVTMKILLLLALAAHQINGQADGSGNGGMDGSGMEGSGSGMGGSGYGMGGSGYGGYGMGGSGYGGDWSGYGGDWMNGGGECCRTKKIWDHWDQDKNGIYDLVMEWDPALEKIWALAMAWAVEWALMMVMAWAVEWEEDMVMAWAVLDMA